MVLKRIALTGASGMVGRHVLASLASQGITPLTASRTRPAYLPQGATWNEWDLANRKKPAELDRLFPDVRAILHVGATVPGVGASPSRSTLLETNVAATFELGKWALEREIPIVFLSGAVVYADPHRANIREDDEKGSEGFAGVYGLSKFLAEQALGELVVKGLKATILRPSSVYGFGLPKGKMITNFLEQAAQGAAIELSPPADDRVDLIHAADVSDAMLQALQRQAWGTYNVASENPVTIREIAETCVKAAGRGKVVLGAGEAPRPAQLRFGLCCSSARAKFGFSPKMSLFQGISRVWREMNSGEFNG